MYRNLGKKIVIAAIPLIFLMVGAGVTSCRNAPSNEQKNLNKDSLVHPETKKDNTKVEKDTSLNGTHDL